MMHFGTLENTCKATEDWHARVWGAIMELQKLTSGELRAMVKEAGLSSQKTKVNMIAALALASLKLVAAVAETYKN